jgi:Xaa-Pro aminopeptidase
MNQDAIDRQVALMRKEGIDAMVAFSHQNFGWVTGFVLPTPPLMRWRLTAVVTTSDGRTALYTLSMEERTLRDYEPNANAFIWEEFLDNAIPVFVGMMKSIGLASARVAIETDVLQWKYADAIRKELPNVTWTEAQGHFDKLRFIKSPREVELIRKLAKLTDKSLREALAAVDTGNTEMDLAGALGGAIYRNGAENFPIMVNASGKRTTIPNAGPTQKVIERGDIIRLEAFGVINGYHAGVARTAYAETISKDALQAYGVLMRAREYLFGAVKPGASTNAIFQHFSKILADGGLKVINFLGHGIGLYLHEKPYFERNNDYTIEENMVLGIEPYTFKEDYALQIKDIIGVTRSGIELYSDQTDVSQPIRIGTARR